MARNYDSCRLQIFYLSSYLIYIPFQLWEDPQNTLRPETSHVIERRVVAFLVARILAAQPSFYS